VSDAPPASQVDPPEDPPDGGEEMVDCPECGPIPLAGLPNGFNTPARLALHRRRVHGVEGQSRKSVKARRPQRATTVTVNMPKPATAKRDPVLEQVEQRAKFIANMTASLVLMIGQEADALDIAKGADPWAASVKNLAKYEDWLKALGQGGETPERVTAWVEFLMATGAMALPILLRHGAIPDAIAKVLTFSDMAPPSEAPADEPVAA
jgi:hypothetical protein